MPQSANQTGEIERYSVSFETDLFIAEQPTGLFIFITDRD